MDREKQCVALRLPGQPDAGQLRRAVEEAFSSGEDWGALEVEVFPGRRGTLLLIHPAAGMYIREDAVRFLSVQR